ncbi:hypothetical protein [Rhodanobacter sp. T12-5]|nr:hypothetical protein [Rhodanobacter sp. T12-5]
MPLADFPHVVRWLDRLMDIPGWAERRPARVPGEQAPVLANA